MVELSDELVGVQAAGRRLAAHGRAHPAADREAARPEIEELVLEEVPDITYADVGGLDTQIEAITDAVELPYLHRELFAEYTLPAPKGILLYGPPGCGKTLIAKAVANSLAKKVAEATGNANVRSYFLNIKGPELLNKYVGETERQIRLVFQRAREKADEGVPVIVFFDEMDSLFRTRGTGISSDMESTIVPQLLAEIDGVESLRDVIVIGASNREDLIDPAILRPGRLDVKIKIERPNEEAAAQIFSRYLTADLPLDADEVGRLGGGDRHKAVQAMIEKTVTEMYRDDDENRFLEVTYQNGDKEILYYRDFASGAMIENIVRRAKKLAIKRVIAGERRRHPHRRPARVDPPGVQGERGPAQHHQPRRLGPDLGQEGRAHRLRPHPAHRGPARSPAVGRSSGWVPASTSKRAGRVGAWPSTKVCGIETEYGIHRPGRGAEPDRRLVGPGQRLRRRRRAAGSGGTSRTRPRATTPAASPARGRCPRWSRPTWSTPSSPTAPATTSTTPTPSTPPPSASTPLECLRLRQGRRGGPAPRHGGRGQRASPTRRADRLQEQLRRQGQLLRLPRELPDGPGRALRPRDRGRGPRTS